MYFFDKFYSSILLLHKVYVAMILTIQIKVIDMNTLVDS